MVNRQRRLKIDLTPIFMSQLGLRKVISNTRWSRIRRGILRERGPICVTCGFEAKESRHIHAHEIFEYDLRRITVCLTGIELLCPWCHNCIDFEQYQRMESGGYGGKTLSSERLIEHYCRINGCSRKAFDTDLATARGRKAKLEETFGCNIKRTQVTYGPYQHEVEAYERAKLLYMDEDEEFDPLPGHELVYAPGGHLYGHRDP